MTTFSEFDRNNGEAKSKSSALTLVFSTFIGKLDIPHVQNRSFQTIRHLTDGRILCQGRGSYDGALDRSFGVSDDLWAVDMFASPIIPMALDLGARDVRLRTELIMVDNDQNLNADQKCRMCVQAACHMSALL